MEIGFTTGSALVIMYLESNNPKIENLTRQTNTSKITQVIQVKYQEQNLSVLIILFKILEHK